jgi:hypothetical protein
MHLLLASARGTYAQHAATHIVSSGDQQLHTASWQLAHGSVVPMICQGCACICATCHYPNLRTSPHHCCLPSTVPQCCWHEPAPTLILLQQGSVHPAASDAAADGGAAATAAAAAHPASPPLRVLWPRLQLLCHAHDKHVRAAAALVCVALVLLLVAAEAEGAHRLLQAAAPSSCCTRHVYVQLTVIAMQL